MINKVYLPENNSWEYIVPAGIRYLSDWEDFDFIEFPSRCIIDKQIPGCGYTEWAIRNRYNVILASPRKILLENKSDQHPGEVFLVRNELDRDPNIDKNLNKTGKVNPNLENELLIEKLGFEAPDTYGRIRSELLSYLAIRGNQPAKILVTYDSYYIIKAILEDLGTFGTFFTVVDEYQSVLIDSRFKSSTESEFMEVLGQVQYVHFVSATPMLGKYTSKLDYFKSLPIYTLNWGKADPGRVIKPRLKVLIMKSVGSVLPGIIQDYLDGNYTSIFVSDGREVISKEAVFYVNSVDHIISMIRKCGLQPHQVNILCSKTSDNEKRIQRKLGKAFTIGSVPTKGNPHKMFTFCTRTVYLGADFYSDNARSFIFSDANSDCLAVDISQDLPQILGRQRLAENPWKNSATFYYRSVADYRKMSDLDFKKIINCKEKETKELLSVYNSAESKEAKDALARKYRKDAKNSAYKDDYISVNTKSGNLIPVFNKYVQVSDERAFDIQQIDYADRFSVFRELETQILGDTEHNVSDLMREYLDFKDNISLRVKFLCNLDPELEQLFINNLTNSDYAKSYYLQLGKDRCKALGYNITKIRAELGIKTFGVEELAKKIYLEFHIGDRILRSDVKQRLQGIYDQLGYGILAKATHLEKFFELKVTRIGKDKSPGYEILRPRS